MRVRARASLDGSPVLGPGFCGWLVVFPGGDYRIEIGLDLGLAIRLRKQQLRLIIKPRRATRQGAGLP
jgi:hypothetical protein